MHSPLPLTRELVLIGGGHAHALVLRRWGMGPLAGVRLTLISPEPAAPYTGMLPGHLSGAYRRHELMIDLVRLARHAGARLVAGRAIGIDLAGRLIRLEGGREIAFDVASLDIGITSAMPELQGFAEHALPAKPLGPFSEGWERFVDQATRGEVAPEIAVLGGGVAGVEVALSLAGRLRAAGVDAARIAVIEAGGAILGGTGGAARRKLIAALARAGVTVLTNARAIRIARDGVHLHDGRALPARFVVGAAGARPQAWLATTGLELHEGFVRVDRQLRSSDPSIFAAGDCAHLVESPRPKAGVFAVRQAPVLFQNLRAALSDGRLRAFRPQRRYLKLVSTGDGAAVADRGGVFAPSGALMWRLKDAIDRRFMQGVDSLRPMAPPPPPSQAAEGLAEKLAAGPQCGGCGAKLSQRGLAAALAALPPPMRGDVLSGPGDDAAVLRHGAGTQVITTDHFRAFTEDPWTFARIAALHALGDVWAMGASPQAALVSAVLPPMTEAMQAAMMREILDAAAPVFRAEGADIVGGHTGTGAELTLGFTVTGLCPDVPIGIAGAQPGDRLILTRPIGSGTILAGEMRLAARGEDVAALLEALSHPQGAAARVLSAHANAMTDVTGFGLAGHLQAMLSASGAGARLQMWAIPVFAGAERLAEAGIRSSLWEANAAATPLARVGSLPRAMLLHDPQTAGGLLAAVPKQAAPGVLAELRAGPAPEATEIGEIVAGAPTISLR
ncbi:MAG: selenide, water dikinase SelD [Rhodobacteraceae bacterium]|nr:selenide, water dikinase SelD [Paracoccaceae bacterium]